MHFVLRNLLAASALSLSSLVPALQAQLELSGTASGAFSDPGSAFTQVTNGPVVSLFESGVPYRPDAPYFDAVTSIRYTGSSFANVGEGEQLDLGLLNITNGITLLGTTAKTAKMDLYLHLPADGITNFKLTTLLFSIDTTANQGGLVPDLFLIGHSDVNSLNVGGRKVSFDLNLTNPAFATGDGASIREGQSATDGLYATLHFSPIPEPSTYALFGAALLAGVALWRRSRAGLSSATL
jgi:hypothetical protein